MDYYFSGYVFRFFFSIPDLEAFVIEPQVPQIFVNLSLIKKERVIPALLAAQMIGWVGTENRQVEIWTAASDTLLKVEGGSVFCIASDAQTIVRVNEAMENDQGDGDGFSSPLSDLDREIILGPALVLALALRGRWSLHASAATFNGKNIAFVGESGRGKSTLARYLSQNGWRCIADDILPLTGSMDGVSAWPHYPQMKLPPDAQPGLDFPEQIPLDAICELMPVHPDSAPSIQRLPPEQAVRVLLSHTAGTRLFTDILLGDHLLFCAQAAEVLPVYQMAYPHNRGALTQVQALLESIC